MMNEHIVVDFSLHSGPDGDLLLNMDVHNRSPQDLVDWTLRFDLPKTISAGQQTSLLSQVGSHVTLAGEPQTTLRSGHSARLQVRGQQGFIRRLTDIPSGLFLYSDGQALPARQGDNNLAELEPTDRLPDYGANPNGYAGSRPTEVLQPPIAEEAADGASPITPRPSSVEYREGALQLGPVLSYRPLPEAADAMAWLGSQLPQGMSLETSDDSDSMLQFYLDEALAEEAYRLTIGIDGIRATASSAAGFFYALCSLAQLLPATAGSELKLPSQTIADAPRFPYRGFMLDCARQFHSLETILDIIDHMACYKLNRFHWHLTDDEGWRLEIKAFPQLTEVGAWRGVDEILEPQFGSGPGRYGGYYSQEDVKTVVEYARQRQILVIPEIDIPGHSRAAIKSVPELLVEVDDATRYQSVQFYDDNVLNPGLPGTYQFLHTVLDEVCELFPGPYVHMGADEVPEGVWVDSPACQQLMAQQGYDRALDLQGHLLRNIQDYLDSKGKQLMGWEEAAHGDKLDHSATIFAWSSRASTATIAAAGYQAVSCAAPFAYLDMASNDDVDEPGFHWAGTADLSSTYAYEPLADVTDAATERRVIGLQALLWSELIRSRERLEYMLFPRLIALAECAWSERQNRDWPDFQRRIEMLLQELARRGINHRPL